MSYSLITLDYDSQFHCLGGACRRNCCSRWTILLSKADYTKIRGLHMSGEMDDRRKKALNRLKSGGESFGYAMMELNDEGSCYFMSQDGLCSLQKTYGFKNLPAICKAFPRKFYQIEGLNLAEKFCGTGCEEVVNLLWKSTGGLKILRTEEEDLEPIHHREEILGDNVVKLGYLAIHSALLKILQNHSYELCDRMILLGMATKKLWDLNNSTEKSRQKLDEWLNQTAQMGRGNAYQNALSELSGNSQLSAANNSALFARLPQGDATDYLGTFMKLKKNVTQETMCFEFDMPRYFAAKKELEALPQSEQFLENLMVNIFFECRYLSKDLWPSYLFFCSCYNFLRQLLAEVWMEHHSVERLVDSVVAFSRSVLHSSVNRDNLIKNLRDSGSDTLGHMVILAKG